MFSCSHSGRFRMTFSMQIMTVAMTMLSLMIGRLRWYEFLPFTAAGAATSLSTNFSAHYSLL